MGLAQGHNTVTLVRLEHATHQYYCQNNEVSSYLGVLPVDGSLGLVGVCMLDDELLRRFDFVKLPDDPV